MSACDTFSLGVCGPVSLHAAPAGYLLAAVGADVHHILAAIDAEWYQATAKVTAAKRKWDI